MTSQEANIAAEAPLEHFCVMFKVRLCGLFARDVPKLMFERACRAIGLPWQTREPCYVLLDLYFTILATFIMLPECLREEVVRRGADLTTSELDFPV